MGPLHGSYMLPFATAPVDNRSWYMCGENLYTAERNLDAGGISSTMPSSRDRGSTIVGSLLGFPHKVIPLHFHIASSAFDSKNHISIVLKPESPTAES